jgi:hypothetical protein
MMEAHDGLGESRFYLIRGDPFPIGMSGSEYCLCDDEKRKMKPIGL